MRINSYPTPRKFSGNSSCIVRCHQVYPPSPERAHSSKSDSHLAQQEHNQMTEHGENLLSDNGGCRSGHERRRRDKEYFMPERRSGMDRRTSTDRRKNAGNLRDTVNGNGMERRDIFRNDGRRVGARSWSCIHQTQPLLKTDNLMHPTPLEVNRSYSQQPAFNGIIRCSHDNSTL